MAHRILYIEDNLDNMVLVKRILLAEGYDVLEARTAKEGIRLAEQVVPDLILMDINMPDMDGLTATSYLRELPDLFHTPIVALTANVMRGVLEQSLAAGCNGYISKPIDVDRFPDQISNFLRSKGS
jgi:two-component system cell cycle response regulator DivK